MIDKLEICHRIAAAHLRVQADAYRNEVRLRLKAAPGPKASQEERNMKSWEVMWEVFEPAVLRWEGRMGQESPVKGLPGRTNKEILDPHYTERDPGKQLRDGLLWAALEFDRVIQDTDEGPEAHLEDASLPPPNAFAVNILRIYALSPTEKRRELIGRALSFATKDHDTPMVGSECGGFLDTLK